MHFHAIILAALSAGALSISLTAKDILNSENQPNVKCEGENNGNDVVLAQFDCKLYEPPNGSYIWVDFKFPNKPEYYTINVFSDLDCEDFMTTLVPSPAITDLDAVTDSDCVFMGEDAHWGSVKVGGNFTWNVIED